MKIEIDFYFYTMVKDDENYNMLTVVCEKTNSIVNFAKNTLLNTLELEDGIIELIYSFVGAYFDVEGYRGLKDNNIEIEISIHSETNEQTIQVGERIDKILSWYTNFLDKTFFSYDNVSFSINGYESNKDKSSLLKKILEDTLLLKKERLTIDFLTNNDSEDEEEDKFINTIKEYIDYFYYQNSNTLFSKYNRNIQKMNLIDKKIEKLLSNNKDKYIQNNMLS